MSVQTVIGREHVRRVSRPAQASVIRSTTFKKVFGTEFEVHLVDQPLVKRNLLVVLEELQRAIRKLGIGPAINSGLWILARAGNELRHSTENASRT
jgi:hypothetical protein